MVALSVETNSFEIALEIYGALLEFEPDLTPVAGGSEYHITVVVSEEDGRIPELIDTVSRTRLAERERQTAIVDDLAPTTNALRVRWPLTP